MVASEELETGIGWDYTSIISQLNKNSKQSGADLGKTIVDTFMADVKKISKGGKYDPHLTSTLSVIDLSKIESLGNSLKELGKSLQTIKLDKVSDLSDALNRAERFGQKKTRDSGHIDLQHFSQIVANKIPKFANEANAVISGVKDAVIYEDSGKSRPNAYGLSIYFPRTESVVTTDYIYGATKGMNDFYSDYLESDKTAPGLDVFLDENVIKGTYAGDDVYEINFYFMAEPDEQGVTEIFSTDEYDADEFPPGEIYYEWDGYEPSLCNSEFCYPISPEWEWGESNNMAYLPVIVYTDLESSGLEGDLMYDVTDKDDPIFIGFWPLSQDESVFQKDLLPLQEGDIVQILSVLYNSEGIFYEPAERLIVDSEFGFSWKVYNWGALNVWVEICDYSYNCTRSEESFSLDGPEVADVNPSEIIPFEQNDPLNMDYEYEGEYVLDYKYDYDDYDAYDYADYNYDEYYDEYDKSYKYIEDEVCWIDESGYAFCESGGCGEDEEGFWICNGDYYGEVVEDSCYVDESGFGVCEYGGCGEDEYDNWICHDEYYGL